ncbi:MAG: hypothetical protein OEM41_06955 [Ignavibacteria bacterium]|nr:hypothetical protein [Ignavibacteria bacterium]
MKRVIVRYKVKPDKANENQELIQAVFAELNSKRPDGLRYASFLQADGQSFVHIASIETKDGSNPLSGIEAFKAFQKDINSRCIESPVATEITEVGSFRMLNE